ncbi:hypothetical protein A9R05_21270 [Burkholderia sp. KK1]|nr:hypothetical protein A9R05_21270 [Burkholderia sp. KK1]
MSTVSERPKVASQGEKVIFTPCNPTLERVPGVPPTLEAALKKLVVDTPQVLFWPKMMHGLAFTKLVMAVIASLEWRNNTTPAFQLKLSASLNILSNHRDGHGNGIHAASISLDGVMPQSMIICAQTYMEEDAARVAILAQFEPEPIFRYVHATRGGVIRVPGLSRVAIGCPANCDSNSAICNILQEFNSAFDTNHSPRTIGITYVQPVPDARVPSSLGIGANLGFLAVYGIRKQDVRAGRARHFFAMLANFARATGIPVVLFCTTGAVAALAEHDGVLAPLNTLGTFEIRPEQADSSYWKHACALAWGRWLAPVYGDQMPDWFVKRIWADTQGLDELRTKIYEYIALHDRSKRRAQLTPEHYEELALEALAAQKAVLDALRTIASGGKFEVASIWRFADHLPLSFVMKAIKPINAKELNIVEGAGDYGQPGDKAK